VQDDIRYNFVPARADGRPQPESRADDVGDRR
jgi:hypothetical protein